MKSLQCIQIPVLQDNYSYLLHDSKGEFVAVVDPSEALPIQKVLDEKGLRLQHIFNTHHHWDHVGGNAELKRQSGCKIWTSKFDHPRIEGADEICETEKTYRFGQAAVSIFEIPGHTLGHIGIWFRELNLLFTGDTLFSLGCGRLFEGTPQQMWSSLKKLTDLPDETLIFCGHEYTLQNCDFALSLDPKNQDLQKLKSELILKRERGLSTVPTNLSLEKKLNPFLRCEDPCFRNLLGLKADIEAVEVFAYVRRLKDAWP